jgi:hypothetical protein
MGLPTGLECLLSPFEISDQGLLLLRPIAFLRIKKRGRHQAQKQQKSDRWRG